MDKGKLQIFYDSVFLMSATLRRNDGYRPFTLHIRDGHGKLECVMGFFSASDAKEFLEKYDSAARWYTVRGYVED